MQYHPKLKTAMEEIKAVLEKHDIAGMIVLHTPGHSEFLMKINPSYSCATFDNATGLLRIKAKLQEDFNGDRKAWEEKVRNTSNMLNLISEVGGRTSLSVMNVSELLDKTVNASHDDPENISHTAQNN